MIMSYVKNRNDDQLEKQFDDMREVTLNDEVNPILILKVECDDTLKELRSKIWNHFKLKKTINEEFKSICNYCDKRLRCNDKHEIRHLRDHFKFVIRIKSKRTYKNVDNYINK